VSVALSANGINWQLQPKDIAPTMNFSQGTTACLNSNPGWIGGNDLGHGPSAMMIAYGASIAPFGVWEYYSRQLAFTAVDLAESWKAN